MAHKLSPEAFLALRPQTALIDVRSPGEFAAGHIPGAHSIPLFTDEQRAAVGTTYVRVGRDQAVELGLELVGPRMVEIVRRAKELAGGRGILLYCWRGGMRSGSVAWLLETAGLKVTLLDGGYKAYRRHFEGLLDLPWQFVNVCGPTGCGKTELLTRLTAHGEQVLDLEGLARHKGSAFGGIGQGDQPTTEHFINLLHEAFSAFDPARPVWCEGESMLIGRVFIPERLFGMLRTGRNIEVAMRHEQRLARLMAEYGCFPAEELSAAFSRIAKRMGREQSAAAIAALDGGDIAGAASLALDYYDKVYARNLPEDAVVEHFEVDNNDMEASAARLLYMIKNDTI